MNNLSAISNDILASTQNLIMNGGYNSFSYAKISGLHGIRKASTHHHFPTNAGLVRELGQRHREDGQTSVVILEQNAPEAPDLLEVYANHWSKCIKDMSGPYCVRALLASELTSLPSGVATKVTNFFRFISSWLTTVMERGHRNWTLTSMNKPQIEAEAFPATVYEAMLSPRTYGKLELFSRIVAPALNHFTPTVFQ